MQDLKGIDPRKRIASLFLTPVCDMQCRFCAAEEDFSAMTPDQAQRLLRGLRAWGFDNIVLGGGEPFMWPHGVESLSRSARDLGFLVQVCTNGIRLPDGFERSPGIHRYILPLEAMDPSLHDSLRVHRNGHHALVLDRMETLAAAGRELTVSTVVTQANLDQLPAIADHLRGLKARGARVHAWHLYRFLPVGRGGAIHGASLRVSREAYLQACASLRRGNPDLTLFRRDDMFHPGCVEFFWFDGERLRWGSPVAPPAASA
ncbi:MAG TPA: radical SAM protein [Holophagaceae bacterium]|nr:radical SAM protein [Holophagaceae bacterium]